MHRLLIPNSHEDIQFLGKKSNSKSLEEILNAGMEEVTDLLPVLFASSHVVLNVLPKSFKFDMVIFEEANRFSIEPSTEIAKLGQQLFAFISQKYKVNFHLFFSRIHHWGVLKGSLWPVTIL